MAEFTAWALAGGAVALFWPPGGLLVLFAFYLRVISEGGDA